MSARQLSGSLLPSDKPDAAADVADGLYATNERLRTLVEISLRLASEAKPDASLVADLLTRAGELDAKSRRVRKVCTTGSPVFRTARSSAGYDFDHALNVAARRGSKLALVICDIQRFRFINETFGLRAGDVLLRHVAAATRAMCNDSRQRRAGRRGHVCGITSHRSRTRRTSRTCCSA